MDFVSFRKSGYISQLVCDYVEEKEKLSEFYNRFPTKDNFLKQIEEKKIEFTQQKRETLAFEIKKQYGKIKVSQRTEQNIEKLTQNNTFTVTTGHQLSLFTGPLYFIYKIVTTIKLCMELEKEYEQYSFVPVYWMASEDHDFEEVNHFKSEGNTIQWNSSQKGMVGDFYTEENLQMLYRQLEEILEGGENKRKIINLFKETYAKSRKMSEATRELVNELFGKYGLVIVDGNSTHLKREFAPYIREDIEKNTAFEKVETSVEKILNVSRSYHIQVSPRQINVFYLQKGSRERIIENKDGFEINNTDRKFTREELKKELEQHPERFSPNVILRPLYQEVILPNICYIGGGGEIAYWMELKDFFKSQKVTFPILLLRNSVVIVKTEQMKKCTAMGLLVEDLFLTEDKIDRKIVQREREIDLDFEELKNNLKIQFQRLEAVAQQTDASFKGAVKAQMSKQIKGLENLEKRLIRAQKRKYAHKIERVKKLRQELFPQGELQERTVNFSEFYIQTQGKLIDILMTKLNPLGQNFTIIEI